MLKSIIPVSILFILFSCNKTNQAPQSIADLQARVTELNDMNSNLDQQRNDLFHLIREFNNSRPESEQFDITSMDTLMGAPERTLLKAMFAEERDISYNGLLKTIVEKNDAIGELKKNIDELASQLPRPYLVQKGDTHYEIVVNYLMTAHGLNKKDAGAVANKTALIDDILPGNQVWLMYKDGVVGSYVTQGDARISPMKVIRLAKMRMIEKAKTISLNESAQGENKTAVKN